MIFFEGQPLFSSESSYDLINLLLDTLPVTSQDWSCVAHAQCEDDRCCPDPEAYGRRSNDGQPENPLEERLPELQAAGR